MTSRRTKEAKREMRLQSYLAWLEDKREQARAAWRALELDAARAHLCGFIVGQARQRLIGELEEDPETEAHRHVPREQLDRLLGFGPTWYYAEWEIGWAGQPYCQPYAMARASITVVNVLVLPNPMPEFTTSFYGIAP